jgi:HSP20 family protein
MSITRWDPFGDMVSLRDAMDRLVNESVVRSAGGAPSGMAGAAGLALDVRDQGNDFVVTASVPGVNPDEVEITVLGDSLRIRGEHREDREEQGDDQRWLLRERRVGGFERTVRLPTSVQASGTQAEFKDGVLRITLPKAETAREHRIPVRSASSGGQGQELPVEAGQPQGEAQARGEGATADAGS